MGESAFPRVNRDGPRARQRPLCPRNRTRAGGRLSGWRRTRPPRRVSTRAAGRAVSLVSVGCQLACLGAVPAGRVLAVPPRRLMTNRPCWRVRRRRLPGTRSTRSRARRPHAPARGVRTPAFALRALSWPARSRCRAERQSRTFHERSAPGALSRPRQGTGTPNGTSGKENLSKR